MTEWVVRLEVRRAGLAGRDQRGSWLEAVSVADTRTVRAGDGQRPVCRREMRTGLRHSRELWPSVRSVAWTSWGAGSPRGEQRTGPWR